MGHVLRGYAQTQCSLASRQASIDDLYVTTHPLSVSYWHNWKVLIMYCDKTPPIRVPIATIVSRDGFLVARFEEEHKQRREN